MNVRTKRYIVTAVVIYLFLGVAYGMTGEMRLAKKYSGNPYYAWKDPYAYLRAAIFSPFWPNDLFWTIYYCGNPFGCPIPEN
ncbi:hypothetical protein HY967_01230 [Candidatus Jorgensenbacteria bacterium]|nr:hypothetical protein [Candidatus Jorgensenbacteria bacterium]